MNKKIEIHLVRLKILQEQTEMFQKGQRYLSEEEALACYREAKL